MALISSCDPSNKIRISKIAFFSLQSRIKSTNTNHRKQNQYLYNNPGCPGLTVRQTSHLANWADSHGLSLIFRSQGSCYFNIDCIESRKNQDMCYVSEDAKNCTVTRKVLEDFLHKSCSSGDWT